MEQVDNLPSEVANSDESSKLSLENEFPVVNSSSPVKENGVRVSSNGNGGTELDGVVKSDEAGNVVETAVSDANVNEVRNADEGSYNNVDEGGVPNVDEADVRNVDVGGVINVDVNKEVKNGDDGGVSNVDVNKEVRNGDDGVVSNVDVKAEVSNGDDGGVSNVDVNEEVRNGDEGGVDNGGGDLEASELSGASSLLKMHEGNCKILPSFDSVVRSVDENEKLGSDETGIGDSAVAGACEDVGVNVNLAVDDSKETRDIIDDGKEMTDVEGSLLSETNEGKAGEASNGNDEKVVEEGEENEYLDFSVGDFVWGKVRSHPWWPGRVYDPSNASDHAEKVKQKDKILVAYFGDGTFSWCNSSQLMPFSENFVEMCGQSNSKTFINAVEKAIDEVGTLVDLKMTCSCVPKENLIESGRTLAENTGIEEGSFIPEGGLDMLPSALFEPAELLASLKGAAQVASVLNLLEFTVLKSWLSAYYRANGGFQLPSYSVPRPIQGLEDDESRILTVNLTKRGSEAEAKIHGPVEDDFPSPGKHDKATESTLIKCQGLPVDGQLQRRKRKSLAAIMEGHTATEAEQEEDVLEEGVVANDSTKNRKSKGESVGPDSNDAVVDVTEGATLSKPASSAGRKRKKISDQAHVEGENKTLDVAGAGAKAGNSHPSSRGRKKKGTSEAPGSNDGHHDLLSNTKESKEKTPSSCRRKKKLSESVAVEIGIVSNLDASSTKVKKESVKTPLSSGMKRKESNDVEGESVEPPSSRGRPKKTITNVAGEGSEANIKKPSSRQRPKETIANVAGEGSEAIIKETRKNNKSGEKVKGVRSDKAKEEIMESSSLRDRKKSKYLSPPYTNVVRSQRKNEFEAELLKLSVEALAGERTSQAASHLMESPSIVKPSGGKRQKKSSEQPIASDASDPQTPNQDQNVSIDPMIVKAPANEVLSKMRSAAVNPLGLKEINSVNVVGDFVSAFRSNYSNVLDGKVEELRSGRKRKTQKPVAESSVKDLNQINQSSTDQKSRQTKSKKRSGSKLENPKEKQPASALEKKKKDKKSNGEVPGAVLTVSFYPGSTLPTKNDLLQTFGKYGPLNEKDTDMLYTNYCARVFFLKTSDGEEAFNDCQLASPFKSARADLRLDYLSKETKTRQLNDLPKNKHSSKEKEGAKTRGASSASHSSGSNVSDLNFVKQRLELVTNLVELSAGKIASDVRAALQDETKVILEKVSLMLGLSSS